MIRRIIVLASVIAAVGVSACNEPSSPAPKPAPSSTTEEPAPADDLDKPDDALPSARKLPAAEDYQAETAAAIVQANYRAELDALETELHAEAK